MDARLPHHLEPNTFIVIDGPDDGGATHLIDGTWRAAHGMGHGTKPLLDRVPVFTWRPAKPEWESAHWQLVVEPALADGRSVFMQGRYQSDVGRTPDVVFLVNPVTIDDPDAVLLTGDDGEVGEGMFAELIQRGLYSGRRTGTRQ